MLRITHFAPVLLAACSSVSADPDPTPIHGVTPGHKCETDGIDAFIGPTATESSGAAILHASHAAVLRWAPPGVMLTMDYREDRVTVHLDRLNKITGIRCG